MRLLALLFFYAVGLGSAALAGNAVTDGKFALAAFNGWMALFWLWRLIHYVQEAEGA